MGWKQALRQKKELFPIKGKRFTWVLPEGAYTRAEHITKFSNLDVYALHALDIVIMKCDRLDERDEQDMRLVFLTIRPKKEELIAVFDEYAKLLKGNKISIENIHENFNQLVLIIFDSVMSEK